MAPVNSYDFMAVAAAASSSSASEAPMSRTHQYRKVMKPLLERKRRARINKCLDELKDLMVYALQSEGESIAKLEKADVLELTVRHMQKLKRQRMLQANPALDMDRYRSGFTACANEVSRCLATIPGVTVPVGTTLMSHLGSAISTMEQHQAPSSPRSVSPLSVSTLNSTMPPMPSPSSDCGYNSGRDSSPSPPLSVGSPSPKPKAEAVWRPF